MIPSYQTCMRPCLAALDRHGRLRWRDVEPLVADELGLSDEDRSTMIASGGERLITNRVGWALTYLAQAGLVRRPIRGFVEITDEGKRALTAQPEGITNKMLAAYPSFQEFQARSRKRDAKDLSPTLDATESATPTDLLDAAVSENLAAVESEVLRRAMELSPVGFEDLVVALLAKMGYGQAGSVERTSASGDAGVDGIISQDPLGLDRIYVQAKRYATDQVIHRPKVHEFAGALLGKQGDRGVYITTSHFSAGARAEAERINARIELIDGQRLAQLLVRYGVGVQTERTAVLLRIDEDFFEAL